VVPASASPTAAATQQASLKIGLMGPFSGLAAAFGQDMLRGAQMALDELNGAGGLDGKRLVLDQGDDKAHPAAAEEVAKKLISDGVVAVIGPATSGSSIAAEGAFNDGKVPMITPSANDPRITDQRLPFVFRTAGRWDQEPPLIVDALVKQPGTPKLALAADTSAYGQALAAAFRASAAKAGGQLVADESVDSGTKDFGLLVAKLKALAPSAVFYAGYAADGGALAKAVQAAGSQPKLSMGDAAEDQALISSGGAAVEGLLLAYPPDPKQVPSAAAFLDAYKRRYGTAASLYAVSTYDTVRLLADAMRRAGSSDRETLRQALAGSSDVSGMYWGKMSFDDKGDLQAKTYVLWTVRNGRFEPASQ